MHLRALAVFIVPTRHSQLVCAPMAANTPGYPRLGMRPFLRARRTSRKICRTPSISDKLVRRSDETPKGAASSKETDDAGYGVHDSQREQRKGPGTHARDDRGVRGDGPIHRGA